MPATQLICLERRQQLSPRLRAASLQLPVMVYRTRAQEEYEKQVHQSLFAIVVIDAESDPDLLPDLARFALGHKAFVIVVGETGSWSRVMHLRELGVQVILPENPSLDRWVALLRRVVEQSQACLECSG